jgi:hypothetical protein
MTQDYRRDPTPEEAYNLQFGVGDDEYLRKLRAEVKPPNLLGGRKGPAHRMERKPGAGINIGLREPSQQLQPAGPASRSYQPADAARPTSAIPARKLLVAGVVVILLIILAIVGRVVASVGAISVGDCVVTKPSVLTGWDIKKVGCNSNPGAGLFVQKVVTVQNGSNGQCDVGLTTFQDDPKGKTYCLEDTLSG